MAATLAGMAATHSTALWIVLRLLAGAASALAFVSVVSSLLSHLRDHPAHLPGRAFGGVGAGIALSGLLVLAIRSVASWQVAWLASAALAVVFAVLSWNLRPESPAVEGHVPVTRLRPRTLFGATFLGIGTIALAAGSHLQFPRAVALLTAGYSVGQILGPLVVTPLLRNGYHQALILAAVVVSTAAVAAAVLRVGFPHQLPAADDRGVGEERVSARC